MKKKLIPALMMKVLLSSVLSVCLMLIATNDVFAQSGIVCGNPKDAGCQPQYDGFEPHELPFLTGRAKLGSGTLHESEEFYAVILESVPATGKNRKGCNFFDETKRLAVQKTLPLNKVFASRHGCVGNLVWYDETDRNFNFLAIYGGKTKLAAEKILKKVKRKYPTAAVKKLRAVLDFADE